MIARAISSIEMSVSACSGKLAARACRVVVGVDVVQVRQAHPAVPPPAGARLREQAPARLQVAARARDGVAAVDAAVAVAADERQLPGVPVAAART